MEQQNQHPMQGKTENKPSIKTNWKFIFIAAVFALLSVGGILLLKTMQSAPVLHESNPDSTTPSKPEPAQPSSSTPTASPASGTPSVSLLADGQEQVGGPGYSCGQFPGGGGFCADSFEVLVPPVPIVLKQGQEVTFRSTIELDPVSLTAFVYGVEGNAHEQKRGYLFNPRDHQELYAQGLPLDREAKFLPELGPGSYVLVLFGLWSRGDSSFEASYGFNVVVREE